jgi:hypothetical protein
MVRDDVTVRIPNPHRGDMTVVLGPAERGELFWGGSPSMSFTLRTKKKW